MKITVVGAGYVGLSNALLFSKQHDVMVFDIDKTRVKNINQRVSPIIVKLLYYPYRIRKKNRNNSSSDLYWFYNDLTIFYVI